ncbi:alpha/beta hydrolase [Glutamicibacter sp. MNS18]|uniref:alpha/beta fold hydrolase n=1 Tax=Glutamicibacter sp. MNS18 TaxID=2989817 RepID=UPI002235BDFB|nr:alpha/beta hydrolase [Glutamicibacter sp. MNS18]MCW4466266.1 alpha/beta hydrolase [Glutamicibacter sp. MNS18]
MNRIYSQLSISDSIRLDYVVQGSCHAPAVLLLPGPTDSWRSYHPGLDALPTSVRAVTMSPRGHGNSDKPADG